MSCIHNFNCGNFPNCEDCTRNIPDKIIKRDKYYLKPQNGYFSSSGSGLKATYNDKNIYCRVDAAFRAARARGDLNPVIAISCDCPKCRPRN